MDLQKLKKILKKIFILPPVPTLLVAIPSYVLVIYVLINSLENEIISYVAYLLSAYAAIITVTGIKEIVRLVRQVMTSATGAGVCLIVLGMAIYMIARSTKILKNIDKEQGGNVG